MNQIKPNVIGYERVLTNGGTGVVLWSRSELKYATYTSHRSKRNLYIHPNGKPKFRPIYLKEINHEPK